MRQRDFADYQWVIVSNVGSLINGAMLQFNTKAGGELFKIKLIPSDAQLFADCFCLIQGKNPFFAHSLNLCLPEPLFLPPPVSLFTVAQARASAIFVLSPFFS